METLTEKQKQVLEFISHVMAESGRTPTVREIAAHFHVTIGPVQRYLKTLVRKGALQHEPGISRGLRLPSHRPLAPVPVLGRVTAGLPAEAIENIEDYVYIDKAIALSGEYFALRVKGDSMTGAGIFEGDIIVVRRQPSAENNDIVVAMIDGEATVKRLRKEGGRVFLKAENPKYKPLEGEMIILGKVIYLSRVVK